MATLRDQLLPMIDSLRQIPQTLGLRRYSVTLRSRSFGGVYPGEGSATDTDTVITPAPRVRVVSTQEIASSGGTYRLGDFKIDRITPRYVTPTVGGWTPALLNIRPNATNQDVAVILTGDEAAPLECELIKLGVDRPFNYWMVVRTIHGAVRG